MEKNKSIDGLKTRRSKQTAQKPVPKKPKSQPKKIQVVTEEKPAEKKISKKKTQAEITADFLKPTKVFDFNEENGKLETSKKPIKKDVKPKKEKKKVSKKRKIITSIILAIVLIIIGLTTWLVLWGNDIIAKITGGQGNILDLIHWVDDTYEPLKTDTNGRTNILAFGTSGYDMEGDEGNGKHDGAQLTDSIMMISLNQETGDIAMLSLPRDLKASPTCTATGKINEVYWCNNMRGDNEQAGAEAIMTEVGSILGIDFQYYVHINWASLIEVVNILDGITIVLDEDIEDYYYTKAVFKAGVEYTINGDQALGLARARHGTKNGDFSRGTSQQKILIGIKNKVFEKDLSISDFLSIASTLGDNLRTNFSLDELKTLAHLTSDFDFDSMRQVTLLDPSKGIRYMTTGTINGISYVLPSAGVGNYGAIQAYVSEQISNDPRVYEKPTILVLNAKDENGVATAEKAKLEEEGYDITAVDNTDVEGFNEEYTIYAVSNDAPGTKNMLETFYNVHVKDASELPEGISKDYDFVIVVGPSPTKQTKE